MRSIYAQSSMFKMGRPSPMRRSITRARRLCTITKWMISSVDQLDQTEGVGWKHTSAVVSFIAECLTMKYILL